jgi:hypothetical protein
MVLGDLSSGPAPHSLSILVDGGRYVISVEFSPFLVGVFGLECDTGDVTIFNVPRKGVDIVVPFRGYSDCRLMLLVYPMNKQGSS